MPSPPDRAPAAPVQTLELKGTTLSVTAVMIGQADTAHLQLALAGKLGEAPGFFDGELAVLDLSRLPPDTAATVQLDRVVALLRQAGMIPVGVRGLPGPAPASVGALGLAVLPTTAAPRARPQADEVGAEAQASAAAPTVTVRRAASAASETAPAWAAAAASAAAAALAATASPETTATSASTPASGAGATSPEAATALVVDRPLRSGQRIYARGRDLVLLAGVSPGAEVIADGSIHCYGRLRGRALAGASGDAAASIFVQDFQAELVSVAGVWRTFEPADPQIRGGQPVRVSLRDDGASQAIAIEPIVAD